MKKILFVVLILLPFCFSSCSSKEDSDNSIIGHWVSTGDNVFPDVYLPYGTQYPFYSFDLDITSDNCTLNIDGRQAEKGKCIIENRQLILDSGLVLPWFYSSNSISVGYKGETYQVMKISTGRDALYYLNNNPEKIKVDLAGTKWKWDANERNESYVINFKSKTEAFLSISGATVNATLTGFTYEATLNNDEIKINIVTPEKDYASGKISNDMITLTFSESPEIYIFKKQ